jgi:hypothetical protein
MTPFIFGIAAWISRKWEREKGGRAGHKKIRLPCSSK